MRVEIFDRREKIQPVPLDGVKRHTCLQGKGLYPFPLQTSVWGLGGKAPLLSLGEASHGLPLFKGALSEWVSIGSEATFARAKPLALCKSPVF